MKYVLIYWILSTHGGSPVQIPAAPIIFDEEEQCLEAAISNPGWSLNITDFQATATCTPFEVKYG